MDANCPENEEWDRYVRIRQKPMLLKGLWLTNIPTTEGLDRSAARCHFCHALCSVISKLPLGHEPQQRSPSVEELFFFGPFQSAKDSSGRLFITLENGQGITPKLLLGGMNEEVELYTPQGCTPPWEHLPFRPEISCSPSSDEAIKFIKTCLEACTGGPGHLACKQMWDSQTYRELPTRLVKIEIDGARLIDTRKHELAANTKYVALSYCWGRGPFLKALKENVETFLSEKGFQGGEMPQALKEAIEVTRRLGLHYIWIDCLCIVQDDPADWTREAARMGAVYENAYLTIALTGSSDVNNSFLQKNEWYGLTRRIAVRNKANLPAIIAARHCYHSGIHGAKDALQEPWTTRGWTYQEKLLSRRTIMFTPDELQWVCPSVQTCECQSRERSLDIPLLWNIGEQSVFNIWRSAVTAYSRRKLKYPEDKLAAISGIAQRLHTSQLPMNIQYVAGLWDDGASNLIHDLTWSVGSNSDNRCGPSDANWRAPTFSWAALDDGVIWSTHFRPSQCIKFEVTTELVNDIAPFGTIKSASLKLTGPVLPCTISVSNARNKGYGKYSVDVGSLHGLPIHHDGPVHISSVDTQGRKIPHVRKADCSTSCTALDLSIQSGSASLLYLGDETDKDTGDPIQQIFLVLAETTQPRVYSRLGLLPIEYPRTDPERPRHLPYEAFLRGVNAVSTAFEQSQSNNVGRRKAGSSSNKEEDSMACVVTWNETDIQTVTIK